MVPARAGVIPAAAQTAITSDGGSRASGGDPDWQYMERLNKKWFPRERG